jgi:hypothetical protein
MLKRQLSIGLLLALAMALVASQAFAGTTTFDVIVPKFGGTANTNVTTKNTNTQQWEVTNITVGAGKTVFFRPEKGNAIAVGAWNPGTTGSVINAPMSPAQPIGTLIYLKIQTGYFEPVNVQVRGTFNSN